jgi:hypothetical protein
MTLIATELVSCQSVEIGQKAPFAGRSEHPELGHRTRY